jgi:acylphosphatase
MMTEKTIEIIVKGSVQGVFFRQTTKEKALELGLSGEVKNNDDGSVTIKATGEKEQIDKLIAWCHSGPPKAKVNSIVVNDLSLVKFSGFTIIR